MEYEKGILIMAHNDNCTLINIYLHVFLYKLIIENYFLDKRYFFHCNGLYDFNVLLCKKSIYGIDRNPALGTMNIMET